MAEFDPPHNHWDADFDQRLSGSLHYLKDRLESDGERFADALTAVTALVNEAKQYALDARYWAEKTKDAK